MTNQEIFDTAKERLYNTVHVLALLDLSEMDTQDIEKVVNVKQDLINQHTVLMRLVS